MTGSLGFGTVKHFCAFILWVRKIPQNSRISHKNNLNFPAKRHKNSPTSFCRSAGRESSGHEFWLGYAIRLLGKSVRSDFCSSIGDSFTRSKCIRNYCISERGCDFSAGRTRLRWRCLQQRKKNVRICFSRRKLLAISPALGKSPAISVVGPQNSPCRKRSPAKGVLLREKLQLTQLDVTLSLSHWHLRLWLKPLELVSLKSLHL